MPRRHERAGRTAMAGATVSFESGVPVWENPRLLESCCEVATFLNKELRGRVTVKVMMSGAGHNLFSFAWKNRVLIEVHEVINSNVLCVSYPDDRNLTRVAHNELLDTIIERLRACGEAVEAELHDKVEDAVLLANLGKDRKLSPAS